MTDTEWRDVVGYEGYYKVSRCGDVKSLPRKLSDGRRWKGGILKKAKVNRSGDKYNHSVTLSYGGNTECRLVSSLVYEAFIGEYSTLTHYVHHKDGNLINDCAENLELITKQENVRRARKHQKRYPPEIIKDVVKRFLAGETQKSIAEIHGMPLVSVRAILKKRSLYRWRLKQS